MQNKCNMIARYPVHQALEPFKFELKYLNFVDN